MKILIRLGAAILVLIVLGFGALAFLLPRIVESDAVRSRIESAARDAIGRAVTYEKIGVGLLPPSLRIEAPLLAGARPGETAPVRAERIELRVSLLPLLARAVVIESLEIEGARIRLVRTPDGIELPIQAAAEQPAAKPEDPAATEPEPARGDAAADDAQVSLAIQGFEFSDGALTLEDRTVDPPVFWELREIDATLRGDALDQPVEINASFALASGGAITARGTASLEGMLDLEIALAALALAPLQPYVQDGAVLSGLLTGTITVEGPATNPTDLAADLSISDARFTLDDIAVNGSVTARAELHDVVSGLNGDFDLDASGAEIRYGDYYSKPSGEPATVSGRIVTEADGTLGVDDVRLVIPNFDATLSARFGSPLRIDVHSATAELAGAEAFVLPLAATPASGNLRVESLRYVADPPALTGNILFDGLTVNMEDVAPITLHGTLIAQGSYVRSRDLTLVTAEQPLAVDLRVSDLFGALRYTADLKAEAVDMNRLITALANKPEVIYGPLDVQGTLAGTLAGERSILEDLEGQLQLDIVKGRLVGVSLLKSAFKQLGALGVVSAMAVDAGRLFGGRDVQKFYGDEFDHFHTSARVVNGTLYAEPATILYPGYGADLTGTFSLLDLSIDMKGRLTIFERLDASIAKEVGADADYEPSRRSISLASVTGTLDAPVVTIAPKSGLAFVTRYPQEIYADKLRGLVDNELGKGASKAIEGALKGILGGEKD